MDILAIHGHIVEHSVIITVDGIVNDTFHSDDS